MITHQLTVLRLDCTSASELKSEKMQRETNTTNSSVVAFVRIQLFPCTAVYTLIVHMQNHSIQQIKTIASKRDASTLGSPLAAFHGKSRKELPTANQ